MLGKFVSILYQHFQCILKDSNFNENKKEKLLEERTGAEEGVGEKIKTKLAQCLSLPFAYSCESEARSCTLNGSKVLSNGKVH